MPSSLDSIPLGVPVDPAQVHRELKKLWERDAGVSTRASLMNFAVLCHGEEAMRSNTELLMEFTREHACRALLIGSDPTSPINQIRAWINAHCHLSRAGSKQVCCEQLSFYFEGATGNRIPNILYTSLDSDLPLYLWWQGEFPDPVDVELWAWVDRLIFDSNSWQQPQTQFSRIRSALARGRCRLVLCDLNWTRSLHLRQAMAQMLDHPANLALLDELRSITIAHSLEFRSTALLLMGWFAAQLKLTYKSTSPNGFIFSSPKGNDICFDIVQESGRSISRCELHTAGGAILCQRDKAGDFFRIEVRLDRQNRSYHHLLPAGSNATATLLLEEIGAGGPHKVYIKALAAAEPFL
jgi:glucose-6-phosphate dehydrogenase assembly protein OpcA